MLATEVLLEVQFVISLIILKSAPGQMVTILVITMNTLLTLERVMVRERLPSFVFNYSRLILR